MPGFFTDYMNDKVLNLVFGATAFAPPTTLYLGLSQASSNKSGAITEPVGEGYARVAITNSAKNFPAANAGTKANATPIAFPAAIGSWGMVRSVFVADAESGGNVLAMADLVTPKTIRSGGSAASVAVGSLFFSHA